MKKGLVIYKKIRQKKKKQVCANDLATRNTARYKKDKLN
jgi:flagellar basal body rod protein FlgG